MIGFNIDKTIQAAAYLLKREPARRENYMRLLKLLYIADRTSLKERAAPICGDTPYAMNRGPVPGTTLDLIKGRDPASEKWDRYIQRIGYDVCLKADPGNLHLSRAEMGILDRVANRFRNLDEWALVGWCHKYVPEYEKNWKERGDKRRRRIPFDDVLEAIGRARQGPAIRGQINEDVHFSKLFADHMPEITE